MDELSPAYVGQAVSRRLPITLNFGRLSYTQPLLKGEWCSRRFLRFLLLRVSGFCRTHTSTDVHERCEKVEKSPSQTTKKPTRSHFLHRARRNEFTEVIPVFRGRGTLCLLVPLGRQTPIARLQHTNTSINCGACGRIWPCYLLTMGSL